MPYVYQADLWCDDCGAEICSELKRRGAAPDDPDDQYSYDSDDYPKYVVSEGESDCPSHCASGDDCINAVEIEPGWKVGCLITEKLTSEGVEYVREAIEKSRLKNIHSGIMELWAEAFSDYL